MESDSEDKYLPSDPESAKSVNQAEDSVINSPQAGIEESQSLVSGSENSSPKVSSRSITKKRKLDLKDDPEYRLKRARRLYKDGYRTLLNDVIQDAISRIEIEDSSKLSASQIGLTIWSSKEKEKLFCALSKKGRNDVHGIALAIGSKAALEVHVYLELLRQAVVKRHLFEPRHNLFSLADVPAASEIDPGCCTVLEETADALSILQQAHEEEVEHDKHGSLWLLDDSAADMLENQLANDRKDSVSTKEILPAVELLNLRNWLGLSDRIFMNSNDLEYNWNTYAVQDETPAIFCTTFLDFYTLTVSITQRLIQSSIFFAMSRLRAGDSRCRQAVRKCDVIAALKVLNMETNSRQFWAKVPRRCHLDVYRSTKSKKDLLTRLEYYEIERLLGQTSGIETASASTSTLSLREQDENLTHAPDTDSSVSEGDPTYESSESEPESFASTENQSHVSDTEKYLRNLHYISEGKQAKKAELLEVEQDNYMEASDRQASVHEDRRLWHLLGRDIMKRAQSSGSPTNSPGTFGEDEDDGQSKDNGKYACAECRKQKKRCEASQDHSLKCDRCQRRDLRCTFESGRRKEQVEKVEVEDVELPKRPVTERKPKEDLSDWRDWVDYRSVWETYQEPISTRAFQSNRRLRIKPQIVRTGSPRRNSLRSAGGSRVEQDAQPVSGVSADESIGSTDMKEEHESESAPEEDEENIEAQSRADTDERSISNNGDMESYPSEQRRTGRSGSDTDPVSTDRSVTASDD